MQYKDFFQYLCELYNCTNCTKHDFSDLPDSPPYGFLIYPNGEFAVVKSIYGHAAIMNGTNDDVDDMIMHGGASLASEDSKNIYFVRSSRGNLSQKAKQTIEDLASYYKFDVEW